MAVEHKVVAERRQDFGTRNCGRLRRRGFVPGNIYGHRQEPIPISGNTEEVTALVTSGSHVVDVELEGHTETAILREVQWDVFATRVLHFDLVRVNPDERVKVEVAIELRGIAPGSLAGGIVGQALHSLEIECPAIRIPSSIPVRIGQLGIGQAVHVSEVELPPYITVFTPADSVIVQVTAPVAVPEVVEEVVAEGAAEPELIERRAEAEEEAE